MGREIRRVTPGWEHPRGPSGRYVPLHNVGYEEAIEEWITGKKEWEKNPKGDCSYEEWAGGAPQSSDYMPKWESEPTHYQIYETVSEGTPVSPVFASKDEMVKWLVGNGYSWQAARNFADLEWCPSGFFSRATGYLKDIATCETMNKKEKKHD